MQEARKEKFKQRKEKKEKCWIKECSEMHLIKEEMTTQLVLDQDRNNLYVGAHSTTYASNVA